MATRQAAVRDRIQRLRLSGGSAATSFTRRHLLPPVATLEVSFDFGYHHWTTELVRDERGELSRVATLRPSLPDRESSKLEDFGRDFLDEIATDVLTDIEVRVDGARATKAAVDALVEAARRHTQVRRLVVPGRAPSIPEPATKPVRTAKERAAMTFADAAAPALARFAALTGVTLDGLDATTAEAMTQLADALPAARADAALAALAALAIPLAPDPGGTYRSARNALSLRALAAYAKAKPASPFAGLLPVLANMSAQAFGVALGEHPTLVARDEMPALLDWFESMSVQGANNVYYAVRDLLGRHDHEALRADVAQRLASHKLDRFHKWTYSEYIG